MTWPGRRPLGGDRDGAFTVSATTTTGHLGNAGSLLVLADPSG